VSRVALLLLAVVTALSPGAARAATARTPRPAPAPVGTLTQLAGAKGCFVDPASVVAVRDCTPVRALSSPQAVVLSPDERFAYTPSNSSHAITAFARSPGGKLSPIGCVSSLTPGCQPAVNTQHAFGIAIAPDGRSLYLTTTSPANTLDQFARDPVSGALAQLAGSDACFGLDVACVRASNLRVPRGLVFSPDGRFLYVTAFGGDDVAVFSRDAATSRLTPASCVRQGAGSSACAGGARDLDGATDVDVSPDGRSLYVTSYLGDALTAFARDPATGALREIGCWAELASHGCAPARGLDGPYDLALSADGHNVYVAARRSSAVAVFGRNRVSGALAQPEGRSGCVAQDGVDGCRPSTSASLRGARGVAVSPDGRNVYAGAFSASAVSVFRRSAATGALRQLGGRNGCIANAQPGRPRTCAAGRGLHGVWGITISRDGKWLYTGDGGDRNSGLAVLRRKVAG
jgi:6-phosphogluconolactonase (cycloisomerase 2 family)